MTSKNLLTLLLVLLVSPTTITANELEQLQNRPQASLLAVDAHNQTLASKSPDTPRIPASTLKILTALMALDKWGPGHRFKTNFYLNDRQELIVKGSGDPLLISEEIDLIASAIQEKGLQHIKRVGFDQRHFSPNIVIDGQAQSDNPYDAPPGALAANFNTIYLRKTSAGLRSAEPQTPLTTIARKAGKNLRLGKHRINIKNPTVGAHNFAEILTLKLRALDIQVNESPAEITVTLNDRLLYQHANSHTLAEIVASMLKYSTNYIANQLFLKLGEKQGRPVTLHAAQTYAEVFVQRHFQWEGVLIYEGAGLSRQNRMSARQLTDVLSQFRPYRDLLPVSRDGIAAKTGTLNGISCLAGFLSTDEDSPAFALMLNDNPAPTLRDQISRQLKQRHLSVNRSQ